MRNEALNYKFLALGFRYPDESLLLALREAPWSKDSLKEVSLEDLQREHTRIFSLSVAGGVPPYETEYGRREIFRKSQELADIAGFYRAFGLEVSEGAHERIDYIGAELELMHWLALKEDYAEEKGWKEKAELCRKAAKDFLQEHLGRWAPFFGDEIVKVSNLEFYRFLGRELDRFLSSECKRRGAKPDKIHQYVPVVPEGENSCDSCPSSSGTEL